MKVKDATNVWLLVWRKKGYPLMTLHYFKNKKTSACGVVKHPTTQPNAVYIEHGVCKTCEKLEPIK